MRVLLLAKNDWANLGYTFSMCLQKVGVDAVMLGKSPNYYKYPNKAFALENVRHYAEEADIIQFMHSSYIDTGIDLSKKRVFVFHGGGHYRDNPAKVNAVFNPIVERTLIQTGDLLGRGAKNEKWVLPAVDIEAIKPDYSFNEGEKIIVGHYPSSADTKGSNIVNKAISELKHNRDVASRFIYRFSIERVTWKEQMERVNECDIYIEQMRLGEWGVSALEAAALGKLVITNFNSYNRYVREYNNNPELIVANNINELRSVLKEFLKFNNSELLSCKKNTRLWVENHHSYKAIGDKLKSVYGI